MKTQVQHSAVHHRPEYKFNIHIRKVRWLPLFVEQWLVPRFIIRITNKGKNVERGELDCEFVEHDEISSFPSVKSNFKDFQHFPIKNFKKGDVLKYNSKIESRFMKPGRYMVRLLIRKRETSHGAFKGVPLIDWRWLEVIKVYSFLTLVTVLGIILIPLVFGIISVITRFLD